MKKVNGYEIPDNLKPMFEVSNVTDTTERMEGWCISNRDECTGNCDVCIFGEDDDYGEASQERKIAFLLWESQKLEVGNKVTVKDELCCLGFDEGIELTVTKIEVEDSPERGC